jgi:hypothetical protein
MARNHHDGTDHHRRKEPVWWDYSNDPPQQEAARHATLAKTMPRQPGHDEAADREEQVNAGVPRKGEEARVVRDQQIGGVHQQYASGRDEAQDLNVGDYGARHSVN